MAWIALQDTVWDHYKTRQLAVALGVTVVTAVGHLVRLWHFAMRHEPATGDLGSWGDAGIAGAAGWTGNPGKFIKAVRECGFLDDNKIHNWENHSLYYAVSLERKSRQQEQTRRRVAEFRAKRDPVQEAKPNPIVGLWSRLAAGLPQPQEISQKRAVSLAARWREHPDEAHWERAIKKIAASRFCCGGNDRGWRADIDFLLRPDTSVRALEGKYDNRGSAIDNDGERGRRMMADAITERQV